MPDVVQSARLTHEGAMRVLQAAMDKATDMGVPQCIALVDASGRLLAFVRMDGGKFLSIRTSIRKAMTAASGRAPTGSLDAAHAVTLGLVSQGRLTNLKAGIPIVIGDEVIGAVGVSSGSGEQDLEVALAGVAALAGAKRW